MAGPAVSGAAAWPGGLLALQQLAGNQAVVDVFQADPVAHDVLQRSAGDQADRSTLGVQRQPKKEARTRDPLRITTSNIDDAIKIMWKTYQILVQKRRDAVDALRVKAEADAPESPDVLKDLLLSVAAAGLMGPTGMIGTAIAGKLIKVGAEAAIKAKVANEALSNAINTGVKDGTEKAFKAITGEEKPADKKARELFFLTQRTALSEESDKVEIYFLNHADDYRAMEAEKRGSGIAALQALQEAVLDTIQFAASTQHNASLDSWLVYMAQQKLAVSDKPPWFGQSKGTDVGKIIGKGTWGKPTETNGVLVVQIDHGEPGDPRAPLKITAAELAGLNSGLRKEIESRPIQELAVPTIAWKPAPGGTFHEFSIGRHEGGVVFLSTEGNRYARNTLERLKFKAWPHLMSIKDEWGQSEDELRKNADLAAEVVFKREIAPRTLRDFGVTLKTHIYGP